MNNSASGLSATSAVVSTDDKTTAIVSYLTIIGFIAAVVIHSSNKNQLGTFHLRQSLGLMLTSVAMIFVGMVLAFIPVLGWLTDLALWFGLFALWFLGLMSALKGECKTLPVVGELYQKWFGGMFA